MIVPYTAFGKAYGHNVVFADGPNQKVAAHGSPIHYDKIPLKSIFAGADIVVLQRQSNPEILPWVLQQRYAGRRVVFEFDDNFHLLPSTNVGSQDYGTGKKATRAMEQFVEFADHCIVSTPDLADQYSKLNKNISVCYNALDDEQFKRIAPVGVTGLPQREGQVRIGYAGSATHQGDFAVMLPPLIKVMTANPSVQMVFIGHDLRGMMPRSLLSRCEYAGGSTSEPGLTATKVGEDYHKLSSVRYYDIMKSADLDIQVAPLANLTFNRAKSYLKLMQAGMMGTPIICSRFGPYRQYMNEAPAGAPVAASCSDEKEWQRTLEHFIDSVEMRRQVAQANLDYVRNEHLMSKRVSQWAAAIALVMKAPVGLQLTQ